MKKFVCLFLILAALLALSGCRGGNPPATMPMTTTPTTQATTEAPATTQPTTAATTQPTIDHGNGPLDTQPTDETQANATPGAGSNGTATP